MKRTVYIVGYPGSGKSTLFSGVVNKHGPHEPAVLAAGETTVLGQRRDVFLRGVRLGTEGITIGRVGGPFPGVDGMQRNSTPLARAWVHQDFEADPADWLLLEGSLLATQGFLSVAHEATRLTVLLVTCKRSEQRARKRADRLGSEYQKENWRKGKITQTDNIVNWALDYGIEVLEVNNDRTNQVGDLVDIVEELLHA